MSEENKGFLEMMGRLLKSGAIDQASYDKLMERLTKAQAKAELWEQKKAQQEEQLQALRRERGQKLAAKAAMEREREAERKRRQEEAARERALRLEKLRQEEEARRHREELERQKQLEHIRQITSMELPEDWRNPFTEDPRARGIHMESTEEALKLSLCTLGRVDIAFIGAVTDRCLSEVIRELRGSIYQDPQTWKECFYEGWKTAEEYLSGNVLRKWGIAMEADSKYHGYFAVNVEALQPLLPKPMEAEDIYVTIGSPWVPTDIIDDFIRYIFKIPGHCYCQTLHDPGTGTWEITDKPTYKQRIASRSTYGTERISMLQILERTLNMKTISVMDEIPDEKNRSGVKRVLNRAETTAALEKQQKLIRAFQDWIWQDERRKKRLCRIYGETYGSFRPRNFDGSFLRFPTMSSEVELYPYQKDAVARILFSPNTLLAHDVGSGKTYIMATAGMELRRMGLSKKNLFVVPNNLVGQWRDIFLTLYPHAKLLCVEPKMFVPSKRDEVLCTLRDEEFDGIIMAYSCFELIELSPERGLAKLEHQIEELEQRLRDRMNATSGLQRRVKALRKRLSQAIERAPLGKEGIFFEDLGITRLFVDEAHNFKNVPIETQTTGVLGINAAGSKKCQDMMDKVCLVQESGGGVVMATGTPITNSITDAFVMQSYLQRQELSELGLQSFDGWIGMFAQRMTEFEVDVDTSGYRLVTRFARFHNLPELTALFASVADFHQVDFRDGIPETYGYEDGIIERTWEFREYLKQISQRAEQVRKGAVDRTVDNMLKITTDGRKAALDMRLVDTDCLTATGNKASLCADQVAELYFSTMEDKSTQLIFCDSSTPKKSFNLYDELRLLLTRRGIPEMQIAYIHDANTEKRREVLFERVRKGQIRVLIGSTFKLGLGVNVQDRLIALHHLDVPWRPADMTQREGRILRQGNGNKRVHIFRYITEGSFDAYSWQLLETKQRFIVGLLSGSWVERSGSDIEDTVLNYAEVKALAIGNPLIKRRVELSNEISRLMTLQKKAAENRLSLEQEAAQLPERLRKQKQLIDDCCEDRDFYEAQTQKLRREQRRELRTQLFAAVQNNGLQGQERILMQYQGFHVILPANMRREAPFLWLQRRGRYLVELGEAEISYLSRVDHVLENLPRHLEALSQTLADLERRQGNIEAELRKKDEYAEELHSCKMALEDIDRELGVVQE